MPQLTPQLAQQSTPVQQWVERNTQRRNAPQLISGLGLATLGTAAFLQESPLFNGSTQRVAKWLYFLARLKRFKVSDQAAAFKAQ